MDQPRRCLNGLSEGCLVGRITKHAKVIVAAAAVLGVMALGAVLMVNAVVPPSRFQLLVAQARQKVRIMSAAELKDKGSEVTVIDVREDLEWQGERIPGAIHLSRGVLERDIEKTIPDLNAEIVVYCASGGRSILAAESLQKMGYARVFSLDGGLQAWLNMARNPQG